MSFTDVLNLSISASWLVLAVVVLRFALRNAPKAFHCALWALVAFRLLCPVSIESSLSLIPSREVIPQEYLAMEGEQRFEQPVLEIVENPAFPGKVELPLDTTVDRVQWWDLNWTLIWYGGMAAMAIYAAYSYLSLCIRVRYGVRTGEGYWLCDDISTPFILGILRPRIYLPSNLTPEQKTYVLAHEKAHLRRLDHWWKPVGFGLLGIHWFNPVMWLAYGLLCRDIELACDEAVIRELDKPGVLAYSEALLACAGGHRLISACPLAFGEVGVKQRIQSVICYKRPGFWVGILAAVLSILLAACFLTDPVSEARRELTAITGAEGYTITRNQETYAHIMWYTHWLPEEIYTEEGYDLAESELILWESDTSRMYLDWAGYREEDDQLVFAINFAYDLPQSGTILVPYRVTGSGYRFSAAVLPGSVHDYLQSYDSGVQIQAQGPEEPFFVHVDRTLYENLNDYLALEVGGLYELTYVSDDMDVTPILGKENAIAEILYSNPDFDYPISELPVYLLETDLTLRLRQESDFGAIQYSSGQVEPVELTKEHFDDLFFMEYWDSSLSPAYLRRENDSAWICHTFPTDPNQSCLLLHQKNGEVYLAVLEEQGDVITRLFRMEPQDPPEQNIVGWKSWKYVSPSGQSTTQFRLLSDGTFRLSEAIFSSYLGYGRYSYLGDELILRTDDGKYIWYFAADGGDFLFDAERSSPLFNWPGGKAELDALADGARFAPAAELWSEMEETGG